MGGVWTSQAVWARVAPLPSGSPRRRSQTTAINHHDFRRALSMIHTCRSTRAFALRSRPVPVATPEEGALAPLKDARWYCRPAAYVRTLLLDPASVLCACLVVEYLTRLYGANVTHTSDEGYWMQRTVQFG